MISIIISTYRPAYLNDLQQNIKETIGIKYEVIAVENKGSKSLSSVYNIGIKKAKYPFLCFAHEDILVKTNNWGQKIIGIFNANPNLGLLSIAGSTYKPCVPSGWSFPTGKTIYMNIIHSNKESTKSIHIYNNPKNELLSKVVSADGAWLCTKKEIARDLLFDEKTFTGFHCYDIDFSLRVFQKKYNVAVTFEVLIEHYSEGNFDKSWIIETMKLHKKWRGKLPIDIEGLTKSQKNREEEYALIYLLSVMEKFNCINIGIFKILWDKCIRSVLSLKSFIKIHFTIANMMYAQSFKRN